MSTYKTMRDLPDVRGKRVLVRSELNVPLSGRVVSDAYRIEQALATLEMLSRMGAKVVVCAHIGREKEDSLEPVATYIQRNHIPGLQFVPDVVGEVARSAVAELGDGDILLLENVRSNEGEIANDKTFARALAEHGEYFVSDAFGATHRAHASIVGVASYIPAYAGLLLEKELCAMGSGLSPKSPSLFILGGAKFATKEALLRVAITRYDTVCIGGALANDFLKERGNEVGKSLCGEGNGVSAMAHNKKILLPSDVVVQRGDETIVVPVGGVEKKDAIVDIGPETIARIGEEVKKAETIIWNGPMGMCEKGFTEGTKGVAQYVATEEGNSQAVGGGDTVAAIRELGLQDKFSFLSTGGGAMLDYLVAGHLPGVDVLVASN